MCRDGSQGKPERKVGKHEGNMPERYPVHERVCGSCAHRQERLSVRFIREYCMWSRGFALQVWA